MSMTLLIYDGNSLCFGMEKNEKHFFRGKNYTMRMDLRKNAPSSRLVLTSNQMLLMMYAMFLYLLPTMSHLFALGLCKFYLLVANSHKVQFQKKVLINYVDVDLLCCCQTIHIPIFLSKYLTAIAGYHLLMCQIIHVLYCNEHEHRNRYLVALKIN